MYHSITFGDKNTWDDWHLIPQSRPVFLPPDVKTSYVEVPGADGKMDMTESLTGSVLYKNRQGTIQFYVDNGHEEWEVLYAKIMNYLHGQKMYAVLEDDPSFYYEGRFSVNTWKSEKHRSEIYIDYDVAPYKIDMLSSKDEWLWDPFNFEIGVIREYNNVRVNGSLTLDIIGSRRAYIPSFDAILDNTNVPITLAWSGLPDKTFGLQNGRSKFPDIKIKDNVTTMTFTGQGIISIDYRGGSL